MKELKFGTKAGKAIVDRVSHYEGRYLWQVYEKPSEAKKKAFFYCEDLFYRTENAELFSICSHNTFQFSCGWFGTKDGEPIARLETANNSYLVWLER